MTVVSDIKDNNNEQHQKIDIRDAASESYAGFAKEIIQDRALPDIRDGLLPVHRRIIYGMMKMGNTYNKPRVKAARSVGEVMGKYHPHGDCLRGNTTIKGLDNKTYTIEDLSKEQKDIEVLALDEDTGNVVPVVAHSFRVGQYTDLIYKITLSNGGIIEVTGNHPIFTEHTGWVKAEDLSVGDLLWSFKLFLDNKTGYYKITKCEDNENKKYIRVVNIEMIKVEEEPMYDFTVDTYENMIIPISSEEGKDTYISVHNSSLYGAIVRQSQDWIVGYPLVDMKGNNGSIDGDNFAASRYTEVRLSKQAEYLYKGLHKKSVVDWMLTYDDSREEPIYLPAQYPNILAQGIKGISAGYATDILPHNIKELLESCIQLLDDPTLNYKQLAVKGPDFPTGGTITNGLNLDDMYEVGKGSVTLRGNYRIENPNKRSKYQYMVFYEIPYDTQKPNILIQIEDLLDKKQLNGVNLARDESGRDGLRLVLEIEKEANVEHIAQILFNKTDLEKKVHMNAVMIDNGKPRLYGLVTILNKFNEFRLQTMVRELNYDNEVDTARLHILEGFLVLVNNTDAIIKTVKQSSGKADARVQLMEQFELSELQANAILDLQIHRMSQVSADDYLGELNQKKDAIEARNQILESDELLKEYQKLNYQTIIDDLKKDTKRRTKVLKKVDEIEVNLESLIQEEDVVVGINGQGFIKRSTPRSYHATDKDGMDDFVLETDTHQYVVVWTNKGNYAFYPVHLIKEVRWGDEGVNITSLGIELESDEIIIGISQYDPDAYYFVLRSSGKGKVGLATDLEMSRYTKIYSVGGVKGDETVIQAGLISPDTRLALQTKKYVKTTKSELTESVIFTPEELGTIGVKAYGRTLARIAKTKELLGVYEIAEDDSVESVVEDNTESEQEVNKVSQLGKGTTEQDIQYRLPLIKYNQDPQHFTHPSVLEESLSDEFEDSALTDNSEDTHNQELAE